MKIAAGVGFICAMAFLAATAAEPKQARETVSVPGLGELALAGPFTHRNLAVYVFYRTEKPGREPAYITLEEGIKSGDVKITEMEQEQVGRLVVSNNSDKRLFLHVGELVHGGKQDRMLQTSLVIPPKSPKAPIPSFCVEQSRWSGKKEFAAARMIAPSSGMKQSNLYRDQGAVWHNVGRYKRSARESAGALTGEAIRPSRTSSVNEELSDKDFKKLMAGYESAMANITKGLPCPLGLAYAVNGEINTVDIYHANGLFEKLLPKLLKSCAAAAVAELPKDKEKKIEHPTCGDLSDFIKAAWDGEQKKEELAFGNVFIRLINNKTLTAQLFYKGELIHAEVIKRTADAAQPTRPPLPRAPNIQPQRGNNRYQRSR